MSVLNQKKLTKEENLNLPVPRLEIRIEFVKKVNDFEKQYLSTYSLVYEHLMGEIIAVPLGITEIAGNVRLEDVGEPFRDGAHIRNEMTFLKLPGFLIVGKTVTPISLEKDYLPQALINKLKNKN